jgi:nitrite reductase (NADH) small subunit
VTTAWTLTPPETRPDPTAGVERWTRVCHLEAILPDTGVAARHRDGQVAIFRTRDDRVFALDNHDPCSGANVLARGLLGDVDRTPVVASPVHKQRFELASGRCLDADVTVAIYDVRIRDGHVEVTDRPRSSRPDADAG